jgi:hypothetical protein
MYLIKLRCRNCGNIENLESNELDFNETIVHTCNLDVTGKYEIISYKKIKPTPKIKPIIDTLITLIKENNCYSIDCNNLLSCVNCIFSIEKKETIIKYLENLYE